jgi:serine/threonine protein kinase
MLVDVPQMPAIVLMQKASGSLWSFTDTEAVRLSVDDMALDLLHGLNHLHQQGFSHGDLSVNNILVAVTERLTFQLTDWGSCYHVDTPLDERDTGTTYCAASPEQVARSGCARLGDDRWGEIYNLPIAYPTDDIWAFACAIIFAITRSLCFHTPNEESSFLNTFLQQCKVLGYPEDQQGYSDSWLEILPVLPRFKAKPLRLPNHLHQSTLVQPLVDLCLQRAPARPADAAAVLHYVENL